MQIHEITPGRPITVIRRKYRPDGSIEEHTMTMRWMDYVELPRRASDAGDDGYWYQELVRPPAPPPPPLTFRESFHAKRKAFIAMTINTTQKVGSHWLIRGLIITVLGGLAVYYIGFELGWFQRAVEK